MTRYEPMPCLLCGQTTTSQNGVCWRKSCQAVAARRHSLLPGMRERRLKSIYAWRAAHREQYDAAVKRWQDSHREYMRRNDREWYWSDPERARAIGRDFYRRNRERVLQQRRELREKRRKGGG